MLSPDEIEWAMRHGSPRLQDDIAELLLEPYFSFQPRPDRPEEYDEQTAFVNSDAKFAICLGGTGSGKTISAAVKTVDYLLNHKPFRERCPFWVIGVSYELSCGVCWGEKLSRLIPRRLIADVSWFNQAKNWPSSVMLKHPDKPSQIGWTLEFKSYGQGREQMQAASIGGYWFNEEVPLEIVEEVQGRCRDYDSPGWADFTPLSVKNPEWPEIYDACTAGDKSSLYYREGWEFFHLNTLLNDALPEGWAERYLASFPEDIRETRRIGVFTRFQGQVFKEWNPRVHVIDPFDPNPANDYGIPRDWKKVRGVDFGFVNPFACVWCAKDREGRWYAYDEHYASEQLNAYHARKIKERRWDTSDPYCGQTYSDHDAQERAELAQLGIHTIPARKNILLGIEHLRSLMQPQEDGRPALYVFRHCENLIREIRNYRWPDGTDLRNPREVPLDKDNHAVDALRYALHSEALSLADPPRKVTATWTPRHGVRLHRRMR